MPAGLYDVGDAVLLEASFTVAGVATDPGAVTIQVKNPDGTLTAVTPSSSVAGTWRGTFVPTLAGDHYYRFQGTSPATAAEEGLFVVRERKVV